MPRLVEGSEPAGKLCSELSQKWGLSGDVIIAGGAGDNAAAACSTGVLAEGQGFVSLGTSGVVLAARDDIAQMPIVQFILLPCDTELLVSNGCDA